MAYDRDKVKPASSLTWYMKSPQHRLGDDVVLPAEFVAKIRNILINNPNEDEADFLLDNLKHKDGVTTMPMTIAEHLKDFLKGQDA